MRIGIAGLFDTGDMEGAALRLVVQSGLSQRLPGIEVVALAPLGAAHPTSRDQGSPALALPGLAELGDMLDCLVVTGPLPLGVAADWAELYQSADAAAAVAAFEALLLDSPVPVAAWSCVRLGRGADRARVGGAVAAVRHVSVADAASRDLLGAGLALSPVAALRGMLDGDALRRRRQDLRLLGTLPSVAQLVVVDAAALEVPAWRDAVAGALLAAGLDGQASAIVTDLSAAPATTIERVSALAAALPIEAQALQPRCPVQDVAAVLAWCSVAVSATPALTALALGSGIPVVALPDGAVDIDLGGMVRLEGPADVDPALRRALGPGGLRADRDGALRAVAEELDAVAAAVSAVTGAELEAPAAPLAAAADPVELQRLRALADDRARQMAVLRLALEAEVGSLRSQLTVQAEAHAREVQRVEGLASQYRAEADRVLGSKTWRWTAPARTAVRRLRDAAARRS